MSLSNVRIHVERVIGLLKNKYQIFEGPIKIILLLSKEFEEMPRID